MMKRVASTIFLLFFTVSLVGRSIERAESWAAQHVSNSKHSGQNHAGVGMAKAPREAARQGTKLGADGWVLDVSFARSLNALPTRDVFTHALTEFVSDPTAGILSSRAPPSLLS